VGRGRVRPLFLGRDRSRRCVPAALAVFLILIFVLILISFLILIVILILISGRSRGITIRMRIWIMKRIRSRITIRIGMAAGRRLNRRDSSHEGGPMDRFVLRRGSSGSGQRVMMKVRFGRTRGDVPGSAGVLVRATECSACTRRSLLRTITTGDR